MTVEITKKVKVTCPTCKCDAEVDIPEFLVKEAQEGVLKVQIPQGACCPDHSFMVYIDKKFKVRGYQNVDIHLQLGAVTPEPAEGAGQKQVLEFEDVKKYTINDMIATLGSDISALVLRAILVGRPILLLDTFDLYNRIDKTLIFLKDLESEDLVITGEKIQREELKDKKIRKANALVVAPLYKAVVRSPFLGDVHTRFESHLLQETARIPDRGGQIIFLRRELIKISDIIDEFARQLQNSGKVYEEDIPNIAMEKFNYKLDLKHVDVVKEVIEFRYSIELAQKIVNKSLDKIRSDLW